ncbi:hypothetical protein LTR66_005331 [Elasticomyces elasticus]|nr:hypothetical protein LTR50_001898 [Elasticomyces elasticus]KAK4994691.1 hypothetical protein LTR66_005331 [Elasticomyces elasticus]
MPVFTFICPNGPQLIRQNLQKTRYQQKFPLSSSPTKAPSLPNTSRSATDPDATNYTTATANPRSDTQLKSPQVPSRADSIFSAATVMPSGKTAIDPFGGIWTPLAMLPDTRPAAVQPAPLSRSSIDARLGQGHTTPFSQCAKCFPQRMRRF